jgi:hypothetical protein
MVTTLAGGVRRRRLELGTWRLAGFLWELFEGLSGEHDVLHGRVAGLQCEPSEPSRRGRSIVLGLSVADNQTNPQGVRQAHRSQPDRVRAKEREIAAVKCSQDTGPRHRASYSGSSETQARWLSRPARCPGSGTRRHRAQTARRMSCRQPWRSRTRRSATDTWGGRAPIGRATAGGAPHASFRTSVKRYPVADWCSKPAAPIPEGPAQPRSSVEDSVPPSRRRRCRRAPERNNSPHGLSSVAFVQHLR